MITHRGRGLTLRSNELIGIQKQAISGKVLEKKQR